MDVARIVWTVAGLLVIVLLIGAILRLYGVA